MLGYRSPEPSKPLFSIYRTVLPVYWIGFAGFKNLYYSGF
jgi:hypothetical protein